MRTRVQQQPPYNTIMIQSMLVSRLIGASKRSQGNDESDCVGGGGRVSMRNSPSGCTVLPGLLSTNEVAMMLMMRFSASILTPVNCASNVHGNRPPSPLIQASIRPTMFCSYMKFILSKMCAYSGVAFASSSSLNSGQSIQTMCVSESDDAWCLVQSLIGVCVYVCIAMVQLSLSSPPRSWFTLSRPLLLQRNRHHTAATVVEQVVEVHILTADECSRCEVEGTLACIGASHLVPPVVQKQRRFRDSGALHHLPRHAVERTRVLECVLEHKVLALCEIRNGGQLRRHAE